jgi:hypothetical protein
VANDVMAAGEGIETMLSPDPHLKAWFELYSQVYQGAEDTEDRALGSARGMFANKSVSRERIRKLRGARPMGRPKKPE